MKPTGAQRKGSRASQAQRDPLEGALWSTRRVASRLKVSEATIKRWSDEGLLRCYRTPGGHRKFRPVDVASFADWQQMDATVVGELRTVAPPDVIDLLFSSDGDGVFEVCRRLLEDGMRLENLLDEVLARALVEVGERWACAAISVAQEHTATSTVLGVLARLEPLVRREALRGTAVSGCLPGEHHDIASRMVALMLSHHGYRCLTPAGDVPLDAFVQLAVESHARIVALSAGAGLVNHRDRTLHQLQTVVQGLRGLHARLLIGGASITNGLPLPEGVTAVPNMRALAALLGAAPLANTRRPDQ